MKKYFLVVIAIFTIIYSVVSPTMVAHAEVGWPAAPEISGPTAIIMNQETGTILYQKNETERFAPASITKIMTAMLAIENCELDEVVTFSEEAIYNVEIGSSSISRDFGEEMTMEQCLYGLMLESANECANAIAEHVAGSMEAFVDLMNQRAAELGCVNTHFVNAHGLYDSDHYTCAYDMALISREAYSNPTFAMICGTKRYTIPPTNKHDEPTLLNNHHQMLHYFHTQQYIYENCVGGKTGYTSEARSTLVTYAKKNDVTLICVVMGEESPNHYLDTRLLFDYYFDRVELYSAADYIKDMENTHRSPSMLVENKNPLEIDPASKFLLPVGATVADVRTTFVPEADNPQIMGQIIFLYGEQEVGQAIVTVSEQEESMYPFHNLTPEEGGSAVKYIQINPLKILLTIVIIVVVVILAIYLYLKITMLSFRIRRKRNEKRAQKIDLPKIRRTNRKRLKRRRRRR